MLRATRLLFAILFTVLIAGAMTPAHATPSSWKFVDVTVHNDAQPLMLVAGELPEDVPLPYEAELVVPSGTQVQWIGEIIGGPPAEDPPLEYVMSSENGLDIYRFTLTRSRTAQIEGVAPDVGTFDGTTYTSTLQWTAWQDVPQVRIAMRLPAGAQIVQTAAGAALLPGDEQYTYYAKTVQDVRAGDTLDLPFAYTAGSAASSNLTSRSGSNNVTFVILALVIVLLGVLIVFARRADRGSNEHAPSEAPDSPPTALGSSVRVPPAPENDEEPEVRPRTRVKPTAIMIAVIAVAAIAVVGGVAATTSARVSDGKVTRDFGTPSPCDATSIPVVASEGVDLSARGTELVNAFTGHAGVGVVTLDLERSVVDVTFCESSQSAATVRQILEATGMVTTAPAPSPTGTAPTSQ